MHFNPRSPYGERPNWWPVAHCAAPFQSTLPLRGATYEKQQYADLLSISIHAPLTGSDLPEAEKGARFANFNPRSPYGERLCFSNTVPHSTLNFTPRSPYGERLPLILPPENSTYFNPRSPYGERPARQLVRVHRWGISIHAPLTGSDRGFGPGKQKKEISIHAPLTGSDGYAFGEKEESKYFNPRSPYGERPMPVKKH